MIEQQKNLFIFNRSVCLMMQTAIPCLLFANGSSQLRLLGGTNAEFAPEIDYYSMVEFF